MRRFQLALRVPDLPGRRHATLVQVVRVPADGKAARRQEAGRLAIPVMPNV